VGLTQQTAVDPDEGDYSETRVHTSTRYVHVEPDLADEIIREEWIPYDRNQ